MSEERKDLQEDTRILKDGTGYDGGATIVCSEGKEDGVIGAIKARCAAVVKSGVIGAIFGKLF